MECSQTCHISFWCNLIFTCAAWVILWCWGTDITNVGSHFCPCLSIIFSTPRSVLFRRLLLLVFHDCWYSCDGDFGVIGIMDIIWLANTSRTLEKICNSELFCIFPFLLWSAFPRLLLLYSFALYLNFRFCLMLRSFCAKENMKERRKREKTSCPNCAPSCSLLLLYWQKWFNKYEIYLDKLEEYFFNFNLILFIFKKILNWFF